MDLSHIAQQVEELVDRWNSDHTITFLAGLLTTSLVLFPVWLIGVVRKGTSKRREDSQLEEKLGDLARQSRAIQQERANLHHQLRTLDRVGTEVRGMKEGLASIAEQFALLRKDLCQYQLTGTSPSPVPPDVPPPGFSPIPTDAIIPTVDDKTEQPESEEPVSYTHSRSSSPPTGRLDEHESKEPVPFTPLPTNDAPVIEAGEEEIVSPPALDDRPPCPTPQPQGNGSLPDSLTLRPSGSAARVSIGFDFGTHSSKLINWVRGEKQSQVLLLDEPTPEYPPFALPSLVRIADDRLYFGRRALAMEDGTLFRSLKLDLLPTSEHPPGSATYPHPLTPDLLVALYMAWVLQVWQTTHGTGGQISPMLNVAAPMNHVENAALQERYLQVVQAAYACPFDRHPIVIEQGVRLSQVLPRLINLLDQPLLAKCERPFEICPETLAPLASLSLDPGVERGLYLMIDMGAGTTEVSMSLLSNWTCPNWRIVCYSDQSIPLGAEQFHEAARNGCSVTCSTLRAALLRVIREVWHSAYQKDKDGSPAAKNEFRKITVIFSGGGLHGFGLTDAIRTDVQSLIRTIFNASPCYQDRWHSPTLLYGPDCLSQVGDEHSAFLTVAHGLALERRRWPRIDFPESVEPITTLSTSDSSASIPTWLEPVG